MKVNETLPLHLCSVTPTLSVAGQSFASSDPDGGAGRGRDPGNSL